jgi:hypothetical protein
VFKDTRELAKVTANMVDAVLSGKTPEINDTKTYNNGVKVVPSYLLKPVSVDSQQLEAGADRQRLLQGSPGEVRRLVPMAEARHNSDVPKRTILEMRGITKTFPGVVALSNVNLRGARRRDPRRGRRERRRQVDLMKVLSGVYPHGSYDRRDSCSKGEPRRFRGIADSEQRWASSSSTRSWRWCRCCRSPRTSSSATRPRPRGVIDWHRRHMQDARAAGQGGPEGARRPRWSTTSAWASSSWWRSPRRCPKRSSC